MTTATPLPFGFSCHKCGLLRTNIYRWEAEALQHLLEHLAACQYGGRP